MARNINNLPKKVVYINELSHPLKSNTKSITTFAGDEAPSLTPSSAEGKNACRNSPRPPYALSTIPVPLYHILTSRSTEAVS
jgi:hypothetical protein